MLDPEDQLLVLRRAGPQQVLARCEIVESRSGVVRVEVLDEDRDQQLRKAERLVVAPRTTGGGAPAPGFRAALRSCGRLDSLVSQGRVCRRLQEPAPAPRATTEGGDPLCERSPSRLTAST